MNYEEKMALFLGMLCGDGCLSIKHNGEGYRTYPIDFCNNNRYTVALFENLFFELFGIHGRICFRDRVNRQRIWHFLKYSHKIVDELKSLGFPEGVKRDVLRVPEIIKNGSASEKLAFVKGLIITDGHIRKSGGILFHLGSRLFLEDLSTLFESLLGVRNQVKSFIQGPYISYQLYLYKAEGLSLLSRMPTWADGTMVLRRS